MQVRRRRAETSKRGAFAACAGAARNDITVAPRVGARSAPAFDISSYFVTFTDVMTSIVIVGIDCKNGAWAMKFWHLLGPIEP